jgi:hypothetical protein
MSEFTANCYGIEGDHKYTDRTTAALARNRDPKKGQKCYRLVIAADTEIMGGEIWINADETLANSDSLNFTLLTTV